MGTNGQSGRASRSRRPRGRGRSGGLALALVGSLALAGQAFATHPSWRERLQLNIDGDRPRERVTATYDVSSDHKLERGSITATDRCGGRSVTAALIPAGKFTPRIALRPAQLGRAAVGIAADRNGGPRVARVVRLRSCRVQVLLAFSSTSGASVNLEVQNDSSRFPGREVVVVEGLRDAARRTYFRWSPARQRYLKYRTEFSAV